MNAIVSAPLLLENEVLRECLRLREAQAAAPVAGLRVGGVVRPAALALLKAALPETAGLHGISAQAQDWPDSLRQLHWELSSSTTLRPLANLMRKAALLPDPANRQGGLRCAGETLPAVLRQHPVNRLYTIVRVDTVIAGSLKVVVDTAVVDTVVADTGDDASAWSAEAGDVLILNADLPVHETLSPDACVWTAYYYSPDPCCCKIAGAAKR